MLSQLITQLAATITDLPMSTGPSFHSEAVQTLFFNQLQDLIKIILSGWDYVMFMHSRDTYLYVMY